jgi:ATP-dependent Clp protease ATP-binding subunit ClpA
LFVEVLGFQTSERWKTNAQRGLKMNSAKDGDGTLLDTDAKTPRVEEFENALRSLIIGQDPAIHSLSSLYQIFEAGMIGPDRPMGTMLFLGPTGSGKTRLVEATAEVLFGNANAVLKVDCAEFQHSHEIAKLIGSPPGYLGHRETSALFTQERLDRHITDRDPFSLVLFDEIEKASDSLWQLLLGILDKATLSLGDNTKVDFSQTIIFMTSNLGAKEMSELIAGPIGFAPGLAAREITDDLDQSIHRAAVEAARRRFSPEFMNRIDKIVVFRSLKHEELRQVLDVELRLLQRRINAGATEEFTFILTDRAKEFLLSEGIDYRYGARHLKRAIERLLVYPLSSLSATRQVRLGDVVRIDVDRQTRKLVFSRDRSEVSVAAAALESARRAAAEISRRAA